ncbi:glycosyl transferase family 1 [Mesonia sp. K7]|uniref:glycosyl transferase family 1 n=1 Tax=Mesonia sp. K7 TaxID=2218606 RepID=UPI000DA7B88C|nr:glycosyl transferase family 1 [Mesonia sp. K7]PZD79298.1 glycosyl transferase family 1 [Mesonia sp. K7]
MNKKVLIILYYWPPAGGPGVQRWLKFVKYLPEFGIEPIVFAPSNPDYPIIDKGLEREIQENLKFYKLPIWEPYRYANLFGSKNKAKEISSGLITDRKKQGFIERLMLFIRGNMFIPDARKFWKKPAVNFLSKVIEEEQIDTVISTGPPHSLHLIAKDLKKRFNINWIADFRDPWTKIGYHEDLKLTSTSRKKHLKLEQAVLDTADKIVTTSFTTQKDFESQTQTPVFCVTNGYDGAQIHESELDEHFTISHIGSLLTKRNPTVLWDVLEEIIIENKQFEEHFKLRLIGKVSEDVLQSMRYRALESHIENLGYLAHTKLIDYQSKTQVLLLVEIDEEKTRGIIPGKLFEYLRANRPILAIGPKDWDVGVILKQITGSPHFEYSHREAIKQQILQWFEAYLEKKLQVDHQEISQFHRKDLTRKLAEIIKN